MTMYRRMNVYIVIDGEVYDNTHIYVYAYDKNDSSVIFENNKNRIIYKNILLTSI